MFGGSASLEAVGATLGATPRSEQELTEPLPSHVILGRGTGKRSVPELPKKWGGRLRRM